MHDVALGDIVKRKKIGGYGIEKKKYWFPSIWHYKTSRFYTLSNNLELRVILG